MAAAATAVSLHAIESSGLFVVALQVPLLGPVRWRALEMVAIQTLVLPNLKFGERSEEFVFLHLMNSDLSHLCSVSRLIAAAFHQGVEANG
mgnify:FL=1|jgi:hypothetical protein|tara:strand:- start:214 stop:486 length:273 start_codon:yes stop_codon:yes gene_type:complete